MHSFPSKTVLVGLLSSLIRHFHIPAILIDVSTFFRFYRFSYQALRMKSGAVDDVLSKNLHLHFQGTVKRFILTTNFILIYPRRLGENIFSSLVSCRCVPRFHTSILLENLATQFYWFSENIPTGVGMISLKRSENGAEKLKVYT